MEITLDAPESAVVDTPAGSNGTQNGHADTSGADDIILNDPSLSVLASMHRSVYKNTDGLKKSVNERLGKIEPQLREAMKKADLKNGNGTQNGKQQAPPTNGKQPEAEKVAAPEPKGEEGEKPAAKSNIQKPTKLFSKPVVEAAPSDKNAEVKYFLSEEADKKLLEILKPIAGDDVKLEAFLKEALPTWRTKVSKASEHENKYNTLTGKINGLPAPLREAVLAYDKGDLKAMRDSVAGLNGYVDYSKPFTDQVKVAVKAHMPKLNVDDPTGEDYLDLDDPTDKKAQNLKAVAEDLFNREKNAEIAKNEKAQADQKEHQQKVNGILEKSIKELEDSLPDDFDKKGVFMKSVNTVWRSADGIDNMFFEKDGTPRQDAATRSFYAIHGPDVVAYYQNALYEAEMEKQSLIASGVGKSAANASNQRNYVGGTKNNLVEQTKQNMKPQKSRITLA